MCFEIYFLKLILISFQKNFFFKVNLRHNKDCFFKSETTFSKQFCPNIFFMFSVLGSRMQQKKDIENRTAVYFCLNHEFYKFLLIFGHFYCFVVYFLIFLQCFSGIQKYAKKDVIHTVILAIEQKIKHFHSKRNFA